MNLLVSKKIFWVSVIIISAISFVLRYANIKSALYCDEATYILLAQNLIKGHLCTMSSFWQEYLSSGLAQVNLNGGIVEPWFDHPPLLAILDIPFLILGSPRLLPIIFGMLSAILIMYLLRDNMIMAVLAGIIFAIFPFAIQLNSMVFLDNGSSFFFLLTIALTSMYEERKQNSILAFAAISAGISFLNKESGIFAILFFLLYLLITRTFRKQYKWLLLSIGIASSWFIAGLSINSKLFIMIFTTQSLRITNAQNSLNTAILNFTYNYSNFHFGSISLLLLVSWISLVPFFFSKGNRLIKLGLASFLITVAVSRYAYFYTWIPVYPFFAIALAYCVYKVMLLFHKVL